MKIISDKRIVLGSVARKKWGLAYNDFLAEIEEAYPGIEADFIKLRLAFKSLVEGLQLAAELGAENIASGGTGGGGTAAGGGTGAVGGGYTGIGYSHAAVRHARIMARIAHGTIEIDAMYSEIDADKCSGCRICNALCPYVAIEFDPATHKSHVISALCKACGACVAACPSSAIKARHFTDKQIFAEIEGVLA